ncbi:MAG: hypothetical protein HOP18_23940 [Deltaproteobacteria bacterium]|nr:hypothetical protein [Deltaproteobacteria bacterium]
MATIAYQELGRLSRDATSLLTAATIELEALDDYNERRTHLFAHLWDGKMASAGEKAVMECLVEEILQKSLLLAAKAQVVRLEQLAQEFLS